MSLVRIKARPDEEETPKRVLYAQEFRVLLPLIPFRTMVLIAASLGRAAAGRDRIGEVGPEFVSKSITACWVWVRRSVTSQAEPGVIALPWCGLQSLGRLPGMQDFS
jgi:hypothetical protein